MWHKLKKKKTKTAALRSRFQQTVASMLGYRQATAHFCDTKFNVNNDHVDV